MHKHAYTIEGATGHTGEPRQTGPPLPGMGEGSSAVHRPASSPTSHQSLTDPALPFNSYLKVMVPKKH
jgi:hypothetical protein